jgi:hypothetical protein
VEKKHPQVHSGFHLISMKYHVVYAKNAGHSTAMTVHALCFCPTNSTLTLVKTACIIFEMMVKATLWNVRTELAIILEILTVNQLSQMELASKLLITYKHMRYFE